MMHDAFARRHIGPGEAETRAMLDALGLAGMDALIERAVPAAIRRERPLELPPARSEAAVARSTEGNRRAEQVMRSFIGMGYANAHTPSVILRNVLENPAWYTAYTRTSRRSRRDARSADQLPDDDRDHRPRHRERVDARRADRGGRSMALAARVTKSKSKRFFVDARCHPDDRGRPTARAGAGIEIVGRRRWAISPPATQFGILLQYPTR
jgi:glycine dehydrogenase